MNRESLVENLPLSSEKGVPARTAVDRKLALKCTENAPFFAKNQGLNRASEWKKYFLPEFLRRYNVW